MVFSLYRFHCTYKGKQLLNITNLSVFVQDRSLMYRYLVTLENQTHQFPVNNKWTLQQIVTQTV